MRIILTETQLVRLIEQSNPFGKLGREAGEEIFGTAPKVTGKIIGGFEFKDVTVKDAINLYKDEYIKKNSINKYNELIAKYKHGFINSNEFKNNLKTGSKFDLNRPVKKVYTYKGVKFSEKEYDDLIKILDDIDFKVKNGGINTNQAQVLGELDILTKRGNRSMIIGYNDEWVDEIGKKWGWSKEDMDGWKSAGGIAPDGTNDIYINLKQVYYTRPNLRSIIFHEYGHMKDPAMIQSISPKYRKNYVPKDFSLTKKYYFHQAELVANKTSIMNSITDITNKWLENKLPKETIISKLKSLKSLMQQGNVNHESIGNILGKSETEGYISDQLMNFYNKKMTYPKEVNKTLSDLVVHIDRIIMQLTKQPLRESVHSSESIVVTHFR